MALFRRRERSGSPRVAGKADRDHLLEWAGDHQGVEAYLEPQTTVTEATVMLIDSTGAWTRRRVPSPEHARSLCKKLSIPVYDAAIVGYPQRKRDYDARRSGEGETGRYL